MKRAIVILLLLAVVLVVLFLVQSRDDTQTPRPAPPAEQQCDIAPLNGSFQGFTDLCEGIEDPYESEYRGCIEPYPGIEINESTKFCVGDYDLSGSEHAIIITGDNVGLTCQPGTTLRGDKSQSGVLIYPGVSNVSISHCNFTGFKFGVLGSGNDIRIFNVMIKDVKDFFISIEGDSLQNIAICGSYFQGSETTGIVCSGCRNSTVAYNRYINDTSNVETPIHLQNNSGTYVYRNRITSSGVACNGLWIDGGNRNLISYTEITMRDGDGLHLETTTGNIISSNTIVVPGENGAIEFSKSDNNYFFDNTVYGGTIDNSLGGRCNTFCMNTPDGRITNTLLKGAVYKHADIDHCADLQ